MDRYITLAIHTYDRAVSLRAILENEGIKVELNNVNLQIPGLSSGVRVRIPENDLPLALRIVENSDLFAKSTQEGHCYLVPVDFSEHSFKAAIVAIKLAHKANAAVHFLYSYIDPYIAGTMQLSDSLNYEIGDSGTRKQMEKNAEQLLGNFAERIKAAMKRGDAPPIKFTSSVTEGVPEDSIMNHAKNKAPWMIVMGTRAAKDKANDMIGSVTAEVLDQAKYTVLTVPAPLDEFKSLHPQNVLFLSNIDQDDILAIDCLYRLFGNDGTTVTIVHVPKRRKFSELSTDKALKRLGEYCSQHFNNYRFEIVPTTLSQSLEEFNRLNENSPFDLIVIPNRRRNAFSRLLNPGLATTLLTKLDIPLLVIPV